MTPQCNYFLAKWTLSRKTFQHEQFDPEGFVVVLQIKYFEYTVVSKIESWGKLSYQTVKLGTKSKLYEQKYSKMIFAIQIKYILFTLSHMVNQNK